MRVAGGHVAMILAFGIFVVANGGIVVGDKEAHQATLHLAQLPYYALFAAAAFVPSWLPSSMCVSEPLCVANDPCGLSLIHI